MLRPDMTIDALHRRQAGRLPEHYGLRITALADGQLSGELAIQPWMLAPNGFLHAASVILLADTCCGYATIAHLPADAGNFTTIELKSNFLGTATEGTITCDAVSEHRGRGTQVWSATVWSPQRRKMALFRCTQMILR